MKDYEMKLTFALSTMLMCSFILLGACSRETLTEGFEQTKYDTWKSGWTHNLERIDLTLNTNPKFVSEGNASLKYAMVTNAEKKDHYGSVKVPLSQSRLAFDMWLETPENVAIV